MSTLFRVGQVLKGKIAAYAITRQIQETVWFAKSTQLDQTVVIKGVEGHPRVENERDVLSRLQHCTPFLRPLVDEIEHPANPTTIVLRHLESHLLAESIKRPLTRKELKHVSRCVLEALRVVHEEHLVHTDVKPDNVFVNLQDDENRFAEVQLGDLGGCYSADSKWATSGTTVGAPIWSSPEVLMEMPWNTAADIWSFGAMLIAPETVESILWLMQEVPGAKLTPFSWITEKEVSKMDKLFIGKVMKLDWRDRPSAKELLEDEWWQRD